MKTEKTKKEVKAKRPKVYLCYKLLREIARSHSTVTPEQLSTTLMKHGDLKSKEIPRIRRQLLEMTTFGLVRQVSDDSFAANKNIVSLDEVRLKKAYDEQWNANKGKSAKAVAKHA